MRMSAGAVEPTDSATPDQLESGAIPDRLASAVGFVLIALLIWLSRLNLPGQIASNQLDTSWSQALSYAFEHRMQAGKDYVFTFGPLGYFQTGVYSPGSWAIRIYGWEFLFMSTVAVTMCLPLRRMYSALERTLYVLALVVLPVELD